MQPVAARQQHRLWNHWTIFCIARVAVPLRTKIEFSRRDAMAGAAYESVDTDLARRCALTPLLATHYGTDAAIAQKVQAPAGRAEPQARAISST